MNSPLLLLAAIPCALGCSSLDKSTEIASLLSDRGAVADAGGGPADGGGSAPPIYVEPGPRFQQTEWIEPASDGGAVIITADIQNLGPVLRTVARVEPDVTPAPSTQS